MSQQNISLKIKIIAVISIVVFLASIITAIMINKNYIGLRTEYNDIYSEQQELAQLIYNQNNAYYSDIIINGFSEIEGGKETVYSAIKQFYRYRFKVDGHVVNKNRYELRKDFCTITFEEYYLSNATNYVSESLLEYFYYLNNKGEGGTVEEQLPPEDIFSDFLTIPDNCEAEFIRETEGNTSRIVIEITNMQIASDISLTLNDTLKGMFNVEYYWIDVARVL